MSEPKGLFDAAIKHLADSIRALEIHSPADTLGESRLYQKQASGLRIGLRVLEAAGKVDKKKDKKYIPRNVSKYLIIRCFDCAWSSGNYTGICDYSASCASAKECAAFKKQVRTLLASLPEKE